MLSGNSIICLVWLNPICSKPESNVLCNGGVDVDCGPHHRH